MQKYPLSINQSSEKKKLVGYEHLFIESIQEEYGSLLVQIL